MRWIGLRVKNAKSITCSQDKSSRGRLFVELTPYTTIHALNCYNNKEDEDCWYQVYADPQTMKFDYEILKIYRKRLKYTQKDVADAIGATVRTYQKWKMEKPHMMGTIYLDFLTGSIFVTFKM